MSDLLLPIGGILLVIAISITAVYYDEKAWAVRVVEHHCAAIGTQTASTGIGTGVGANGTVVTTTVFIPEKTIYQCDDGMVIR